MRMTQKYMIKYNYTLIYPYFFVNLDTQGVSSVLMWIGILSVAFVVVAFLFFGIDKIGNNKLNYKE